MELVGTLFATAIGSAGAAAAGTATAGAAAGGLGSAAALLSGAGTVFSAVSSIGAGIAKKNSLEAQAQEASFEARNEYIAGKETSAALRSQLARTISNQTVAFAASGVDLSSVSVQTARDQSLADAERELGGTANATTTRSLALRRRAQNLRAGGRAAMTQGVIGAVGAGIDGAIDRYERG